MTINWPFRSVGRSRPSTARSTASTRYFHFGGSFRHRDAGTLNDCFEVCFYDFMTPRRHKHSNAT